MRVGHLNPTPALMYEVGPSERVVFAGSGSFEILAAVRHAEQLPTVVLGTLGGPHILPTMVFEFLDGRVALTSDEPDSAYVPVTFDQCDHIRGPFYHGTKSAFEVGDRVIPGQGSNFHEGRVSNNVYFSALIETAVWGAELATALAASGERGRIYVVEPTGPFEDDPNVTNKKFPGNITESYRSRDPLTVVSEVETWEGHAPEVLQGMLDNIARLREQGLDIIED